MVGNGRNIVVDGSLLKSKKTSHCMSQLSILQGDDGS